MNTINRSCSISNNSPDGVLYLESCLLIGSSITSIVTSCVFISTLGASTGQTGPDVRSLLVNSSIACLIRSTYLFFRGIYFLFLLQYGFDRLAVSPLVCWLIEFPYGTSAMATVLSMLAIAINRYYATGRSGSPDRYTRNMGEPSAKTKLTIILVWITAVIYFLSLLMGTNGEDEPVCFCYYPLILKPIFSYSANAFFLVLEITILITYSIVLVRSRNTLMRFTLRSVRYDLRGRCRAWTNIRATRMLLPPTAVHAVLVLIIIASLSPIRDAIQGKTDYGIMKIVMLIQLAVCLDALLFPVLCIAANDHFRKAAKRITLNACRKNSNSSNGRVGNVRRVSIEAKVKGNGHEYTIVKQAPSSGTGERRIIDYRLPPEVHEHIVQRTWDMKK